MTKRTRKYVAAESMARQLKIRSADAETLYRLLNEAGYQWNSDTGAWDNWQAMPADEPSELIRIRCWARADVVEMIADGVVESMRAAGLQLMERSQPYPCRPPQQRESRIYLTFAPRAVAP